MTFGSGGRRSIQLSYERESRPGSNVRRAMQTGQGVKPVRGETARRPGSRTTTGAADRARGISRVLSPPRRGRIISLGPTSLPASSSLPGTRRGGPPLVPYLALLRVGFAVRRPLPGRPVRSYHTVSPLPEPPARRPSAVCSLLRFPSPCHQTAPGCYPAPCPAELGLSSGDASGRSPRGRRRSPLACSDDGYPTAGGPVPSRLHSRSVDPVLRECGGALMMTTRA